MKEFKSRSITGRIDPSETICVGFYVQSCSIDCETAARLLAEAVDDYRPNDQYYLDIFTNINGVDRAKLYNYDLSLTNYKKLKDAGIVLNVFCVLDWHNHIAIKIDDFESLYTQEFP